jgi:epoxyqueuosine reductase
MQKESSNPTNAAPALDPVRLRTLALEQGFTEAGLVSLPHANAARDASRFSAWIDNGKAGSMHYLARVSETRELLRARVATPFPWARSALVCFANYNSSHPRSTQPAPSATAWIARYAWSSRVNERGERRPSDYHKILLKRLRAVESHLHAELGSFESRAYVDTGPVVERSLAVSAGLGWTGKNTCLIHPRLGSFGFLAVLLTSLESAPESRPPQVQVDRCGSCTRCLEACPTGALTAPYQMDATRCISYLTIEHKGPIDPALMHGMGRQVFGCDICQDVCPWNRKAPIGVDPELEPRPELVNPTLEWLASLDEQAFEHAFNGSPVRRAGFAGFRRNLAVAMGASGLVRFVPVLHAWSLTVDEGIRAAVRWALMNIQLSEGPQSSQSIE